MRFFEFKKYINKPVIESTRGIKGAVDDVNDKGMESPFSTKEGGKFIPSNSWFFPLEVSQSQYLPVEADQSTDPADAQTIVVVSAKLKPTIVPLTAENL